MNRADREAIEAALGQRGDDEDFRGSFLLEDENGVVEEDEEVYEEESFDDSEDL